MTRSDRSESKTPQLVRQIGLGSGIAVVVGSTIGSGIFRSPSGIAEQVPGPLPMLLVWLIGGFFVLCGALTLSEVGSAFPYSGGLYVYIREAYGRTASFLFGWAQLVLIRPASIGAVAIVFGQYSLRLSGIPESHKSYPSWSAGLAIAAIVLVAAANVFGVKFGSRIQNLTTIAKVVGLLALIVLALGLALPRSGGHFTPAIPEGSFSISMFGLALVSALWAYDGWADGSYVGGEMVDAKRNLPKATILGTLAIMAIYLLANVAYLSVFTVGEISNSPIIAADAMQKLVGIGGATFIVGVVMISTFGTLNGSLLTSPRIFFAMSEDRLFFEPLARVHPRFHTPHLSVLLSACLGASYVVVATAMSGSKAFTSLTDAFVIGLTPFYALAVGSIFVFRRRRGRLESATASSMEELPDSLVDPYEPGSEESHTHDYAPQSKALLYPVAPVLFILSALFLLSNSLMGAESRTPTLITLGIVAVGAPLFYLVFGRSRN